MVPACRQLLRRLHPLLSSTSPMSSTPSTPTSTSHLERTAGQFRAPDAVCAVVASTCTLSPTVREVVLRPSSPLSFEAGQWVDLFLPGVERVGGFSMCSSPHLLEERGLLRLAVKVSAAAPAAWVHGAGCREGVEVGVRVGGGFLLPSAGLPHPHSLLLVAGGVGINPLLSMWHQARHLATLASPGAPRSVTLLYSARREEELVYLGEVQEGAGEGWQVQTFVTGEGGRRVGREEVGRAVGGMEGRVVAYLCGPPGMAEEVAGWLEELGVAEGDVRYEAWW